MHSTIKSTDDFLDKLSNLQFDAAFNPYRDRCGKFDVPDAPAVRRANLKHVLDAAQEKGVASLWIARDLGYRGGRRTGLALTDEMHLEAHGKLYGSLPLARATNGPALSERTATVIWDVLSAVSQPIFLWNVFPLHPHERGDAMSNRCHTRAERHACRPFIAWLLETLRPSSVIAIGRDAQSALSELDIISQQVRHPSYGGQTEFVSGMYHHYGLPSPAPKQATLPF
ncbi:MULTISPECIES: uracil-DNA glycosylase [unclassified Rhizobium]|uniref:uracil-DNA glycosylase n=1 Tax=unclassified Rhizobium TaxID=2613769 RepID=UPI001781C3F3|nr:MULTISPECIES: uracil-DNA glycosylase [unclassified Rhizobium]MBD8689556.1 uracil-DNA glycosylase [Rhizobium sp. CFBP 13644]MBD8693922.1 uracil-DNA glycosylase [Rhizobium sp. CFBP 13717]